jgi:hypothetical protein
MLKKAVAGLVVLVVACGLVLWTPRQADAYYVQGYFYNPHVATYYPSVSTRSYYNPYTGGAYVQQRYSLSRTPYTGSFGMGYYAPWPSYPTPAPYAYPFGYYGY